MADDDPDFKLGDIVETVKGAKFWGEIIAFDNDGKSAGCTVLAVAHGFEGTKHVYPLKQLRIRSALVPAVAAEPVTEPERVANLLSNKWLDPECGESGCQSLVWKHRYESAVKGRQDFRQAYREARALPSSASERERRLRDALRDLVLVFDARPDIMDRVRPLLGWAEHGALNQARALSDQRQEQTDPLAEAPCKG